MATTPRAEGRKTPWFPAGTKPVRVGPYQTEDSYGLRWFNWFNGCTFLWGGDTIEEATSDASPLPAHELKRWRGLTKEAR